jgi:hypothetical protein
MQSTSCRGSLAAFPSGIGARVALARRRAALRARKPAR